MVIMGLNAGSGVPLPAVRCRSCSNIDFVLCWFCGITEQSINESLPSQAPVVAVTKEKWINYSRFITEYCFEQMVIQKLKDKLLYTSE